MIRVLVICCLFASLFVRAQDFFEVSSAIGNELGTCIEQTEVKKIAMLDLQSSDGPTEFAQTIPELILEAVQQKASVKTVTRTQFNVILKEHKLKLSGLMDPANQKKLGKFSSIDALVVGKYREFGEFVLISVQVLNVETAERLCSVSKKLPKTGDVRSLLVLKNEPHITDTNGDDYAIPQDAVTNLTKNKLHAQVQQCRIDGKKIVADLLITNLGEDRQVACQRFDSTVTNQLGFTFKSKNFINGGGHYNGNWFYFNLVSGVPTKLTIEFNGDVSASKILRMLELRYSAKGTAYKFQFRNLRVSS